ncbi:hypothetical protein RJ641_023186 [Dillenia turbinata]|uniref:Mediator of RNA polymerase II transcription subunit n=1 Tax=Dillenia turbinata TaxID=194707 RepID=A0AAN8UDR3_9MAGN
MEVTSFSSSLNTVSPLSPQLRPRTKSSKVFMARRGGGRGGGADDTSRDYEGKMVDENMIVLRMRIQEMKMLQTSYEPPSHWMEWEKRYSAHYHEDVCEAIGLLQTLLINARPSLALGTVAILMLSVPVSSAVVFFHVVEMAKAILFNSHI